jgi:preprotein translocase subunit YajC
MDNIIALMPIIMMLAVFYLVLYIPERRRRKKFNEMIGALKVNDEIVTRGGIMGKITNIQDDYIIIQTGPDRARIKLTKNSIASVVNNSEENK